MPQSVVPNVVRAVMQYIHLNQVCENVYHFSSGAAPTLLTMNALVDALIAWESGAPQANRSNQTSLQRIIVTDLSVPNGLQVDRAVIPAIVGSRSGTPCPGNVTFAVAFRTGRGGRSYRGRAFHIGMDEGLRSGNQILPAAMTGLETTYTGLLTVGVAPIWHLQVVSRFQSKVKLDPAIATPVTAVTLDPYLDSQRRRLVGK